MELAFFPILFGAVAAAIGASYVGDLGSSIATLFGGRSVEEAGALYDKQNALSKIITMAVLADGEVTDAEADNLRHLFRSHPQFAGDPEQVIERLRELARQVAHQDALENTIRVVGADLDRAWKDDAFRFVAVLALRGSGFGTRDVGFRSAPLSDPDALLGIFARALDVEPATREAAIDAARRLSI